MLSPQATKRITYINYGIFIFFASFYAYISFGQHYVFSTHFYDLAIHTHTLKQYAEGNMARFIANPAMYALGDHFSLTHILYVPFYYLFGSYSLLVVQFLFMLFAALGIWRYIRDWAPNVMLYSPLILLYFFSNWGLFTAMRYDFHPNVPGAMMIPWLILFYRQRKKLWFWIVLVFIVFCQENCAMFMFMLVLALSVEKLWKGRARYNILSGGGVKNIYHDCKGLEIPALIFCLLYFYVLLSFIMPAFHSSQLGRHAHLGTSAGTMLWNLITEPSRILIPYQQADIHAMNGLMLGIMIALFGGTYLVLLRPWFLIALIGFTAWRYLSSYIGFWMQSYQYSVELAPFFSIVLIDILRDMKLPHIWKSTRPLFSVITPFFLLTIVSVFNVIGTMRIGSVAKKTKAIFRELTDKDEIQNRNTLIHAMSLIPDSMSVLTQENITPHLLNRPAGKLSEISLSENMQLLHNAPNYVLLSFSPHFIDSLAKDTSTFDYKNFKRMRDILHYCQNSPNYTLSFRKADVYLFKRKDVRFK